jgi:hypothetical protein
MASTGKIGSQIDSALSRGAQYVFFSSTIPSPSTTSASLGQIMLPCLLSSTAHGAIRVHCGIVTITWSSVIDLGIATVREHPSSDPPTITNPFSVEQRQRNDQWS